MKRFFLASACAAALAISAGSATAQAPAPTAAAGYCSTCGASASSGNIFSRLAFWKQSSCSTCGQGSSFRDSLRLATNNAAGLPSAGSAYAGHHHGRGGAAPAANPYPNGTPGTLVFPQHPFVRSPRDFFMTDAK